MLPTFNHSALLETALTHRSALNEPDSGTSSPVSNERLEFLGDAVLELAVTKYLYALLPDEPEGVLTAYRSALVKTTTLAMVGRKLGLGQRLFLSKGEEATGGRDNESLLADTTEAVIGALYLDQGFAAANRFIEQHILPEFAEIKQKKLFKDAKSYLQELVQSQGLPTPIYQVVGEEGPDHLKVFTVQVLVGENVCGQGQGNSKHHAQQAAATAALAAFEKN